jgi:hypothetical protein
LKCVVINVIDEEINKMNTLLKVTAGAALAASTLLATLPANAFWGSWGDGPWYGGPWYGGPWWGGGYPYYGGWGGPWGGYGGYPYGGWGGPWGGWGGYPYYGGWGGYPYAPAVLAPVAPATSSSAK